MLELILYSVYRWSIDVCLFHILQLTHDIRVTSYNCDQQIIPFCWWSIIILITIIILSLYHKRKTFRTKQPSPLIAIYILNAFLIQSAKLEISLQKCIKLLNLLFVKPMGWPTILPNMVHLAPIFFMMFT